MRNMAYKLDKIDRRILFELDRNCRIPDTVLAKKVRRSKESVRYRIKKLVDDEIILGFTTWIDPTKLGYQTAKIYLSLANNPEQRKKFIEKVKKDKRLFWLGLAEGAWNAGLTYFVRSNNEFFDLKNELFSEFKDLILDSKTGSLVSVNTHEKTFLYEGQSEWLTMFDTPEEIELDGLSKQILHRLFMNGRENIASIAHDLGTSVDKVRLRMRRMEKQGVISRYVIALNYQRLGYEFYKTFLYFHNLSERDLDRLMAHALRNKHTIHLVKQISPWDIELETMCSTYEEYNAIIGEITQEFSGAIQKVETAIMGEDYVFPSKKPVVFSER
jgi:DNA-binding Lrp family transcriptional regulator